MLWMKKRFCDISPLCFKISVKKETLKRHIKNIFSKDKLSKTKSTEKLPVLVYSSRGNMIKRAPGVDLKTQFNKAENIRLACKNLNGILVSPGETFSFYKTIGKISKRKGYKEGRVIILGKLTTGIGGGLCNLGNTIHLAVLHSPLTVTEVHMHSDALAPDEGKRVPLSNGTAVGLNYVDFRFKNTTDQRFQLFVWCDGEELCCELRAEHAIEHSYQILEREHRFCKKNENFYRVSKIYRVTYNAKGGVPLKEELIWDNCSKVMYDYKLISKELISV